jgi:hypothetical protein
MEMDNRIKKSHQKSITQLTNKINEMDVKTGNNIDLLKVDIEELKNTSLENDIPSLKSTLASSVSQYNIKFTDIDNLIVNLKTKVTSIEKSVVDIIEDESKRVPEVIPHKIEDKQHDKHLDPSTSIDYKLDLMKEELTTRIDDVENNVTEMINEKFQNIEVSASHNLKPVYTEPIPVKKKRVKSAAKQPHLPSSKLEEMRRWLEYQRNYTAGEIRKIVKDKSSSSITRYVFIIDLNNFNKTP